MSTTKPTLPRITITVNATTAIPKPPSLSDGLASTTLGGTSDENFTTIVQEGQEVAFAIAGDITHFNSITNGAGSDIFATDPLASNSWIGIIGNLAAGTKRDYTLSYNVRGARDNPQIQDPKLQMKT